jgi:hypothetical protein
MIPASFIAGDTVEWEEESSDYPATDGWALAVYFTGSSAFTVAGVADGATWDVTITAANSATYLPGIYRYAVCVTKATERHTIREGQVEIRRNLASTVAGYDGRSHARKTLALIEAAIESSAVNPVESITIAGRTLQRPPLAALIKLRSQYRQMVRDEEAAEKAARGLDSGKQILARFK